MKSGKWRGFEVPYSCQSYSHCSTAVLRNILHIDGVRNSSACRRKVAKVLPPTLHAMHRNKNPDAVLLVVHALLQMQYNNFQATDAAGVTVGEASDPLLALLNHSCRPNARSRRWPQQLIDELGDLGAGGEEVGH